MLSIRPDKLPTSAFRILLTLLHRAITIQLYALFGRRIQLPRTSL